MDLINWIILILSIGIVIAFVFFTYVSLKEKDWSQGILSLVVSVASLAIAISAGKAIVKDWQDSQKPWIVVKNVKSYKIENNHVIINTKGKNFSISLLKVNRSFIVGKGKERTEITAKVKTPHFKDNELKVKRYVSAKDIKG